MIDSFSYIDKRNAQLEIDPLPNGNLNVVIDDGLDLSQIEIGREEAEELIGYLRLWLGEQQPLPPPPDTGGLTKKGI